MSKSGEASEDAIVVTQVGDPGMRSDAKETAI